MIAEILYTNLVAQVQLEQIKLVGTYSMFSKREIKSDYGTVVSGNKITQATHIINISAANIIRVNLHALNIYIKNDCTF